MAKHDTSQSSAECFVKQTLPSTSAELEWVFHSRNDLSCGDLGLCSLISVLELTGGLPCHGPRLKLKTRAVLRPRDVFFGRQRSA